MPCDDCTRALARYPWGKCISDQRKRGFSKERAEKICGYIKDKYGSSMDDVPADAHLEAATALALEPDEADAPPDVAAKDLKDVGSDALAWIAKAGTEPEQPDNPPAWARDKAKWERAKAAVKKYWDKYSEPWAVVAYVYQQMGGKVKSKAKTTAATMRLCRGPCVLLAIGNDAVAEGDSAAPKPRWLEVAYTGHFKGHWMGEFEFTRKTFEQIVANLRRHPAYVAGAEQATPDDIEAGKFDVVQFDFHHASEMNPTEGDIAVNGAPAQGWVLDGKVQDGDDGRAHLWVYARFMEPANTYLSEKRYKWVSVSVDFNGTDPVSAEPVGAVLTSVALTNHPFLQELPPIAATRASRVDAGGYYYGDPAMTPEEAFEAIRRCLGLPETADASTVAGEVAKLKQWSAPGATAPAGVDVAEHIAKFRAILSLPILSTEEEVFLELDKLFARMSGATTSPAEGAMAAQRQETTMTTTTTQGADLRSQLAQCLSARLKVDAAAITDAKILLQVEQGMDGMENLAALLESLGASNVRDALAKVADAKKISDAFTALMPKYEAAQAKVDEFENADAEQDVEMAMASQGWDPKDPQKAALRKLLTKERKAGKAEFRAQFGITDEVMRQHDAARAHLTAPIATERQTADRGAMGPIGTLSISNGRIVASRDSTAQKPLLGDGRPNADSTDITDLPGVNIYAKAEAFVMSQLAAPTDYDNVHKAAVALVRSHKVHVRAA